MTSSHITLPACITANTPPAMHGRRRSACLPVLLLILATTIGYADTLNIPITVKESAGWGANNWPVTVVAPLPCGTYQNTDNMVLRDTGGSAIPAQFSVLNRWVARDNSIRHLVVHFQATVGAYAGSGTGTTLYYLKDDGPGVFSTPLSVSSDSDFVTVKTGPLKFTINKHEFNILDEVWLDANGNGSFEPTELMLQNSTNHGAVLTDWQGNVSRDASRTNITVEIEESGPVRAVIKVSSPTIFITTNNHTHGFAARIYAYAGQPYIKVDYQLQNCALNTDLSWPLYFDSYRLDFNLLITNTPDITVGLGTNGVLSTTTNAVALVQSYHSTGMVFGAKSDVAAATSQLEGWTDIHDSGKGVGVFLRNFWQTWPNGIRYTNSGALCVEFFPDWSCQYFATNNIGAKFFTDTGLYWLEDMQATFKELVLYFHDSALPENTLRSFSAQIATPPIPVLPLDWYRSTHATLDLNGVIPPGTPPDADTSRQPTFSEPFDYTNIVHYRFGWDNYYLDETIRKYGTATTGGWPDSSASRFIAIGNPSYYYDAERKALAELNIRPHWLPGYNHERDFDRLRLTTLPYSGQSWRRFDGHGHPWLAAEYLPGTTVDACPRDDQHGWYQQMSDWYHCSANLWTRDWYEFIAQFRYTSLLRTHLFEDLTGRARGHSFAHAMAALRATGNTNLLRHATTAVRSLRNDQLQHGGRRDIDGGAERGASWQAGYVGRSLLEYMNEIVGYRDREWAEAFSLIAGMVDWNKNHANFSYYHDAFTETNMESSSTGLIMVDLQSWYALATGDADAMRQTFLYITNGIYGGETPAGKFDTWIGQYESRQWLMLTNAVAAGRVFTSPPPVAVFSATAEAGRVVFNWRGMPGGRRYHVCWSEREISLEHTLNTNYINWWAAETTLTNVVTTGGENLSLSVASAIPAGTPVSACIFYFDADSNMSVKTEIARPPIAAFTGGPLRGAAPLTVNFINQTLRQISGAHWSFGDGEFAHTHHATHTYSSAGDHTVSLTVSNAAGSDTLTRNAYVHVVPPGMPIADFACSTNRGHAPLFVQFTNLSIGNIISNTWSFGDGEHSYAEHPSHTFATPGVYTVTLVAYTHAGADTCSVEACIDALPPAPTAGFSGFPTSGGYPLSVQFTNTTTGVATNWFWNFGDNQSSAVRDPTHLYAATGAYTVALTAIGPGGSDTATRSGYITVLPEQGDDYRIVTGSDDANEVSSTVMLGEDFIYLGHSRDMFSGFRFTGVKLPPSAFVTRAYIQFRATSGRAEPNLVHIRTQKSAAPATFTQTPNNLSSRPLTTATVDWDMPAWEYDEQAEPERTPDLSVLVREAVTKTGWTNGGALVFMMTSSGNYGEQGMRHACSREYAEKQNRLENSARLHIEYQTNVNFSAFQFRAVALTNSVMLRWTPLAQCGLPDWHAHIRADTNDYPATLTDGVAVTTTTNAYFHETDLPVGQTRYYTLWISPDGTNNWMAPSP